MKRIEIPFLKEINLSIPAIKLTLPDSTDVFALVDTGASSSAISKDIIKYGKEESNNKNSIIGIAGDSGMNAVHAVISCKVEDSTIAISGFSADLSAFETKFKKYNNTGLPFGMLIGSNTLEEYKATIDYNNRKLILFYDLLS